jgi:hypothetical protein
MRLALQRVKLWNWRQPLDSAASTTDSVCHWYHFRQINRVAVSSVFFGPRKPPGTHLTGGWVGPNSGPEVAYVDTLMYLTQCAQWPCFFYSSMHLAVTMSLCRPCLTMTQYRITANASFVLFLAYFTFHIVCTVTPQLSDLLKRTDKCHARARCYAWQRTAGHAQKECQWIAAL